MNTNFVIADSCSKFFSFSFLFLFLFSSSFFSTQGGPFVWTFIIQKEEGRGKYSSFLFEELFRSNSSSWNYWLFGRVSATNRSRKGRRTRRNRSRYPCRCVFTHSCGCSSSTLIIREWRGWLEGWPRIGILLCRVFRNSTFELFQFRFSLRCAGIFKIRFDDKHNILLFVDCRVSFFFLFFSFLRLFFFHCYYFIYATLCFNVIKKTNRATNRANCVIIWFSWFLFALRVKIFTLCSAITTVCIYRSIEDKACSWNILWRLVN